MKESAKRSSRDGGYAAKMTTFSPLPLLKTSSPFPNRTDVLDEDLRAVVSSDNPGTFGRELRAPAGPAGHRHRGPRGRFQKAYASQLQNAPSIFDSAPVYHIIPAANTITFAAQYSYYDVTVAPPGTDISSNRTSLDERLDMTGWSASPYVAFQAKNFGIGFAGEVGERQGPLPSPAHGDERRLRRAPRHRQLQRCRAEPLLDARHGLPTEVHGADAHRRRQVAQRRREQLGVTHQPVHPGDNVEIPVLGDELRGRLQRQLQPR